MDNFIEGMLFALPFAAILLFIRLAIFFTTKEDIGKGGFKKMLKIIPLLLGIIFAFKKDE